MAALHIPAFLECIQRSDIKAAIEIFEPLEANKKFELLKAGFLGKIEDEPAGQSLADLIWFIMFHSRDNGNLHRDKFFEKFVLATRLIEPTTFINLLMKNLLHGDSAAVGHFLNERESFKSTILSYGLDFFLSAGLAPNQTTDATNPTISFVQFLKECQENEATTSGILFPSPANMVHLSSSPFLMEYLEVFSSKGMLNTLLAEPVFNMLVSACSIKSRVRARNFLIEKKLGSSSKSLRGAMGFFLLFVILELVQGESTIVKQYSGLMLASGIVKVCSYIALGFVIGIESETVAGSYFLGVTASNGMFAISVNKLGALKWVLFGAQLLPIIVALKASDLPILLFPVIPTESNALEHKIRGVENKFLRPSFCKLLSAAFLLTAVVTVVNLVALFT